MAAFFSGHQRSRSQVQQLIPRHSSADPEEPSDPGPGPATTVYSDCPRAPAAASGSAGMRFSVLAGSDCSSSYYRLPGTQIDMPNSALHRSLLRANLRVVIGSMALTLLGSALLIFGTCVMLFPNDMDVHGWVFLVVGVLFAIPGFYHVIYIGCALCGRPGYSFENLPTFTKPNPIY